MGHLPVMARHQLLKSISGLRSHATSTHHPPPPPELKLWMNEITARRMAFEEVLHFEIVRRLQGTLPTRLAGTPSFLNLPNATKDGPLPKAYHLAFFNPQSLLTDLGEDGSSTEFNAPAPYLRRMWAGGSFHWSPSSEQSLRVGVPTTQLNGVVSADYKNGMIFVNQQRDLYQISAGQEGVRDRQERIPHVREIRTHVFRREVLGNDAIKARAKAKELISPIPAIPPTHSLAYTPTAPLLFRFSALTYNAHRIHYDRDWCRSVENHPDLVVHGPLTAMLLVELAEKVATETGQELRSFEYRATSPMYVDKEIQMEATPMEGEGGRVDLAAKQDGRTGMRAVATLG